MVRVIVATILFYTFAASAATPTIGKLNVGHYCAFKRERPPAQITYFDPDPAAIRAVRRITSMMGLAPRFEIKAADVANAAAVIEGNKRYILYNPDFMETVNTSVGSNWPEISILAHEIAHHLNNHTLENNRSRPETELEADQFSGFILQKMGASLNQAKLAMQKLADDKASSTHPAKSTRIVAIASGWRNAKGNQIPSPSSRGLVSSSPLHNHNGRQHSHPLPPEGLSHEHNGQHPKPVVSVPVPKKPQVLEPEMVAIRGGSFMMGSPASEAGPDDDERVHHVSVGDFSIGKHEVTVGEFRRFADSAGYRTDAEKNAGGKQGCSAFNTKEWIYTRGRSWKNPGFSQNDKHPVTCVSQRDTLAYANWLSNETGSNYKLPTEAQWEYAASSLSDLPSDFMR